MAKGVIPLEKPRSVHPVTKRKQRNFWPLPASQQSQDRAWALPRGPSSPLAAFHSRFLQGLRGRSRSGQLGISWWILRRWLAARGCRSARASGTFEGLDAIVAGIRCSILFSECAATAQPSAIQRCVPTSLGGQFDLFFPPKTARPLGLKEHSFSSVSAVAPDLLLPETNPPGAPVAAQLRLPAFWEPRRQ